MRRLPLLVVLLALPVFAAEPLPGIDPGQTGPAAKVEVPAVQRGRIAEIQVQEGQAVKKGDVLARLDTTLQEASVALQKFKADSETEINYARVALDYAKTELEKYKKATASPADIRSKELAVKQAEAYLAKSIDAQEMEKLALRREQVVLEQMTIRSPIDGFVHRLNKQAGEAIDENQPLAVVVQTNVVLANFFLPEKLFGTVKAGDKATVELASNPPIVRAATVVAVDPYVDPAGHLFRVKMSIDNADNKIPVGVAAVWVK